ncbi:hypothetical protein MVEN_01097900 [Mycena venus]|uniref:DUF6534 domain-containing protein n=1 Tax=Mycena venus TaxID=2733690 RepID=A0A8H6Y4M6_9AGAR|nr:hypothetical protein MVEN_01097900 [Mycena venus]
MDSTTSYLPLSEVAGPAIMFVDTQVVGYFLNWGLLGALTVQLYLYYQAFPRDSGFTKSLVYTVYVIVLVQTVLMTCDAFTSFVYGFGDPSALTSLGFEWFSLPILSSLVAFIGQSFYAYRIHVLLKSWKMPISLISSIGAFLTSYFARRWITISSAVTLGGSALSDIIIATCLIYSVGLQLFRTIAPDSQFKLLKSDTGFQQTHALILRLIWITIETGSVTAVMALASLILMFAFPDKVYFFTLGVVLPMVYANTILAVLNSRFRILDGRGYTPSEDIMSFPSFLVHGGGSGGTHRSVTSPIITVERDAFGAQELDDISKTKGVSRAGTPS